MLTVDDFSITGSSAPPDTQPPQISSVATQNLTSNTAQIVWQTDEAADSQVEYGLTTNYGVSTPLDLTQTISHTMTLSGLQANTTYHYRVKSKDAAGNLATSNDFTFTTLAPPAAIFADDFNAGTLDLTKWNKGANAGNQAKVTNNALELKSTGTVTGWIISKNKYAALNTTAAIKVTSLNNDGNIGISPTYNLSSTYGIYNETNWYRFYVYRSGSGGPYRLYAAWKKNGVYNDLDVTGTLAVTSVVYLRLRFDNTKIHFEASLDGATWTDTYSEVFDLPGYSLSSSFYYELAAYNTTVNGVLTVDDFSISGNTASSSVSKPASLQTSAATAPTSFDLQNYPNPFNAATRIRFSLPQEAEIEITVYDALGREVRELLRDSRPAGNYEMIWNGRNHAGVEMSTGFYLMRLRYRLAGIRTWSQAVHRVMLAK